MSSDVVFLVRSSFSSSSSSSASSSSSSSSLDLTRIVGYSRHRAYTCTTHAYARAASHVMMLKLARCRARIKDSPTDVFSRLQVLRRKENACGVFSTDRNCTRSFATALAKRWTLPVTRALEKTVSKKGRSWALRLNDFQRSSCLTEFPMIPKIYLPVRAVHLCVDCYCTSPDHTLQPRLTSFDVRAPSDQGVRVSFNLAINLAADPNG